MNWPASFDRRSFLGVPGRLAAASLFGPLFGSFVRVSGAAEADGSAPMSLFKGDTLEGWKTTDFFRPGEIRVRDGVVKLGKGNPMTGLTIDRKDLPRSNFDLNYEARRIEGDDFFAAATFPVEDGHLTFVNGGWSGNVTGLSSIDGADASENETGTRVEFENGVWYRFSIQVRGRKVKVIVDGKPVIDFDGTDRSLRTRVESRPSEPLGFACFGCVSEIRAVTLRATDG